MSLINNYKSSFKGDAIGGLTAAIVAIPTALAFGALSGWGPEAGLFTAIFLALVASFIGGTQTLISDPTGPMTLVAAGIIAEGDPASALLIFMLVGVLQVCYAFIGVAKYVKYIPYPVVSGFMGGIGIIIIKLQLLPLIGLGNPDDKSVSNILSVLYKNISEIDFVNLGMGIGTIAIIYGVPYITKKVPSILVALIAATLVMYFGDLDIGTVSRIELELHLADLSVFQDFDLDSLGFVITSAVTLSALGVIDTLLTSVVADNITKTKHRGNRELLGQGIGNFVTALLGGFPGAGSTSGTVINSRSGAKTHLSGIIKGLSLLIIALFFGGFMQYVPLAALAGILFTVGVGVIDLRGLKMLGKVPKTEALVLVLTLLVTVFDDLLYAVALGALLSTIFFMEKMSKVVEDMNTEGKLDSFARKEKLPEGLSEIVHVIRLDGPVFFGFADDFKAHFDDVSKASAVVVDMKRVPFTDQTGILTLMDSINACRQKGIDLFIVGANDVIYQQMEKLGVPGQIVPEDHFFPYFRACVKHLKHLYQDHIPNEGLKA